MEPPKSGLKTTSTAGTCRMIEFLEVKSRFKTADSQPKLAAPQVRLSLQLRRKLELVFRQLLVTEQLHVSFGAGFIFTCGMVQYTECTKTPARG